MQARVNTTPHRARPRTWSRPNPCCLMWLLAGSTVWRLKRWSLSPNSFIRFSRAGRRLWAIPTQTNRPFALVQRALGVPPKGEHSHRSPNRVPHLEILTAQGPPLPREGPGRPGAPCAGRSSGPRSLTTGWMTDLCPRGLGTLRARVTRRPGGAGPSEDEKGLSRNRSVPPGRRRRRQGLPTRGAPGVGSPTPCNHPFSPGAPHLPSWRWGPLQYLPLRGEDPFPNPRSSKILPAGQAPTPGGGIQE